MKWKPPNTGATMLGGCQDAISNLPIIPKRLPSEPQLRLACDKEKGGTSMIEGKFLAIFGLGYGILIAVVSAADASTWALAAAGMITAVGMAALGLYKNYRTTKHDADVQDGPLLQGRVVELQAKVVDLQVQLDNAKGLAGKWQALYEARDTGQGKGQPSGGQRP